MARSYYTRFIHLPVLYILVVDQFANLMLAELQNGIGTTFVEFHA